MQEVVANVDQIRFDLEVSIENQVGIQALPFTGMDSKTHTSLFWVWYIIVFN